MRVTLTICLCLLVCPCFAAKHGDTTRIFFGFNESHLNRRGKFLLDSLTAAGYYQPGQQLLILGYTDYVGADSFNNALSNNRALSVRNYLKARLSVNAKIVTCAGKGEIAGQPLPKEKGRAADRFVDIVVIAPANRRSEAHHHRGHFKELPEDFGECCPELSDWAIAHNKADETDLGFYSVHYGQHEDKPITINTQIAPLDKSKILQHLPRSYGSGFSQGALSLALIYGLAGDKDSVFYYLNIALDSCKGGRECEDIWDPNILGFYQLRPYRGYGEWQAFESKILARFREQFAINNPRLALRLIVAGGADQSIRWPTTYDNDEFKSLEWKRINKENKILLKEVITKYGFPKLSDVGESGSNAAFLLVQHLDDDPDYQQFVLEQMKRLAENNEIDKTYIAYLTDRVMVNTTGTQLYGTQFKFLPNGQMSRTELFPITDEDHVNERRKQMNLPPLETY